MRAYPTNSPEAAARILALVLIADGHVCQSEMDALNRLNASDELGLPAGGLSRVLQALCEDLLMGDYSGGSMTAHLDDEAIASLMAEVDDPVLQATVLHLASAIAQSDQHLAEGEAVILDAARQHWRAPDLFLGRQSRPSSRAAQSQGVCSSGLPPAAPVITT